MKYWILAAFFLLSASTMVFHARDNISLPYPCNSRAFAAGKSFGFL